MGASGMRVLESLQVPDPRGIFFRTVVCAIILGLIAFPVGKYVGSPPFLEGKFKWNQNGLDAVKLWAAVIRTFFFPSMAEELVWRAALLPRPDELKEGSVAIGRVMLITILFLVVHIWPMPNILDKLPGRARQAGAFAVFREWKFMLQVATLDVAMVLVYYWDGTIWPCVLLHWIGVVVMQWCYGYDKKLAPQLEWPGDEKLTSLIGQ